MLKYLSLIGFFLVAVGLIISAETDKTLSAPQAIRWDFEPDKLAQKICRENSWLFKIEYTTPLSQRYFHYFRFFEVIKPIPTNVGTGNLLMLVISLEQKAYILHQTLSFEEIENKESFYPQDKEAALEIAILKEELSKDYNLWAPHYSLVSQVVEEDRDHLIWQIRFNYQRPALRTFPGPVYGENEKAPLQLVPEKQSEPLPGEHYVIRTIRLIHPLKFEIEKLIALLGNDDWATREKATNDLIAIGKPVVASLQKVLQDPAPDAEVSMRANSILERIK